MSYHVYMKSRRRLGVRATRQNLTVYPGVSGPERRIRIDDPLLAAAARVAPPEQRTPVDR